ESVGKKPSFQDCVIAMAAVMNDSLLLTFDKDFRQFEEFGLKMKLLS
ncbi:VapC toxin family PIN domain ribonuclease, partial [Candidatus Micrarchaeota archaeon CG_4_10_14_0_2_um_filter_49_7]